MKNTKTKYNNEKGQTLLFVIVAVTIAMAVGVAVSTRTIQSLKRVARTDTSARVIAAAEGGIENLLSRTYSQLDKVADKPADQIDCSAIGAITGPEGGTCSYVFIGTGSEQVGETCNCTCNYCASACEGAEADKSKMMCPVDRVSCSTSVSCDKEGTEKCTVSFKGSVAQTCVPKLVDKNSSGGDLISSRAVVKVETYNSNEPGGYSFDITPGEVKEIFLGQDYTEEYVLICWDDSP